MEQLRNKCLVLSLWWIASCLPVQTLAGDGDELFEESIRPVLAGRCVSCHGSERQSGGLRLDERKHFEAAVLQDLAEGRLDVPKQCRLAQAERETFRKWVKAGLPWPTTDALSPSGDSEGLDHWAFAPVRRPDLPKVKTENRVLLPVDTFIAHKRETAGLPHSPEADRRTLIRRASYTLTGLPPTPEVVEQFVSDDSGDAYKRLVERLLESPHYGEHWARHWLDIARYSDTKGYVYAREERTWAHAWTYRDWVVAALNRDLPYDRFVMLQIAADQLVDSQNQADLAAMGFLTLGRRFLGVERDIIDDRIDVVTRGTMGLTVSCARCHDHMYDPIPTTDYYSLYGVFASSRERLVTLPKKEELPEAFTQELAKRQEKLSTRFEELRRAASDRARSRIADYLFAQTELSRYPANGFDQIFSTEDLLPGTVHRWADFLRENRDDADSVLAPWHAYAALDSEQFEAQASTVTFARDRLHASVSELFETPPTSMRDVADRYGTLLAKIGEEDDPELRRLQFGPASPSDIPDLPIAHTEVFFDSASVTELYKLEGETYRWINDPANKIPHALVLEDRDQAVPSYVFERGDPLSKGQSVPRRFPEFLSLRDKGLFQNGSGRLELARAIARPDNPLTARVIVNRVWEHHFGRGLVDTPSDFGLRCDPPSHPQLLDWLAAEFTRNGWSLKWLHRQMLLSATFRQTSTGPVGASDRRQAAALDPSNRLYWRMNARRLSWEQFRDSMFAASEQLDDSVGGRAVDLFSKPYARRRTLYGIVDRQFLPDLMRTFDFASPDLHIPRRSQTTVPQQALFFMNDPLVLDRARELAAYSESEAPKAHRVAVLMQRVLQRDPTELELRESLELVASLEQRPVVQRPETEVDWKYGYGVFDENTQRTSGFTQLPHFTGEAWQGSSKWPDAALGWVQLTAEGGHPGNDRQHAAIRRWTAPRDIAITLESEFVHEPPQGDGVRVFVISSRDGVLHSHKVHQQTIEVSSERIELSKGDSLDFVVDIDEKLNSDQFLWTVRLTEVVGKDAEAVVWNSREDFPESLVSELTAWEQLAHLLLCSNEFLFVD